MVTWKLKGCPRCGGDTFIYEELCGWYEHCLQCGYMCDLRGAVEPEQHQDYCEKERKRKGRILEIGKACD